MKLNTNFHVPTALKTAQHLEEDTCSPGMLLKLQALLLLYQNARSLDDVVAAARSRSEAEGLEGRRKDGLR